MKKFLVILYTLFLVPCPVFSQAEVYPSHWWVGMKWNKVQLMIYRPRVAEEKLTMLPYGGVKLLSQTKVENPNYIFLDLQIDKNAKPGNIRFRIDNLQSPEAVAYLQFYFELKTRRSGNGTDFAKGVTASDLVYLLMPDRFSNGDVTNDRIAGMKDQTLNRDSIYHRHGGDLQGVVNHLDYLKDLGVTAVWMTPVIENDMPDRTEHGYAFTNHYKIEPRFGGATAYKKLSDELHKRDMKLIQDAVYNHVGLYHFTVQDPPMKDWLHQWPEFTQTNYKDQVWFDPYVASNDKKKMGDGWFTRMMPDMNHSNPFVVNYLIQHAIWSVEEFGVDGWRIDTYMYNDLQFMNKCNKALYDEYPKITLFGETWVHGVPNQSYFCENNYDIPFKSNLQATTDFQMLFYGIQPTVNEPFGWTDGVNKLYTTAAQDYVYKDPMRQVIFLGNHDLNRFYSVVGEDTAKYKIARGWLLTFRGIPQLYYGDEILMTGFTNPDGWVRLDFQGGWPGDKDNKFTKEGRTEKENKIFDYLRKLANFRKNSSAITSGKMMQFLPADGVYTYFRYDSKQTVMVVMNTADNERKIDWNRFAERTNGFLKATNVVNDQSISLSSDANIPGKTIWIMKLGK